MLLKAVRYFSSHRSKGTTKMCKSANWNKGTKYAQFHHHAHTSVISGFSAQIFTSSGGKRPLLWADILKATQCIQKMVIFWLKAVIFPLQLPRITQATLSVVKGLFIAHLLVVNHVTKAWWRHLWCKWAGNKGNRTIWLVETKGSINEVAVN